MKRFLLFSLSIFLMIITHITSMMGEEKYSRKYKPPKSDTIVFYNAPSFTISLLDSIDIDNAKFLELVTIAANYIDSNQSLPLTIIDTNRTVKVNTADFYYMMARWLRWVKNNGSGTSAPPTVKIIRNIGGPPTPSGTTSGTFTKDDLLTKGQSNADHIDTQKYVPNFSTIGTTQYSPVAMFYAWVTMINYYAEHTTFPSSVTITTVSAPSTWTSNSENEHPRLLFNMNDIPNLKQKITKGRSQSAFNLMKTRANSYLNLSTNPYVFNGAISGRALAVQVFDLVLTGYLTDNNNYINKAIDIICAVATQSDVNTFVNFNEHLAVADMAHTYAIAYDWLEPFMDNEQKQLLENEIYSYGQWLYDNSLIKFWGSSEPRRLAHNHQAVAHGALGLCGLVLGDKAPTIWVQRATDKIKSYFDYAIDATGCAYEGMGYLAYGLQHAIPFAEALRRSGGCDIIMEKQRSSYIPQYYMHQLLPGGGAAVMINQTEGTMKPAGGVLYIITKYQDRLGLWGWDRMVGNDGDKSYGSNSWLGTGASLPYVILWEDQQLQPLSPKNDNLLNFKYFDRGQISSRDGWDNDNSLMTFTCGFGWNGCWNHGDVGSFTFYAKGESFVIDPGPNLPQTICHTAITVENNGQDWIQNGSAPSGSIVAYRNDDLSTYIKGNATSAYQQLVNAKNAIRQILYVRGTHPYLIVTDNFELNQTGNKNFQWRLTTHFNNEITVNDQKKTAQIDGAFTNAKLFIKCLFPQTYTLSQNVDANSKYKQLVITSTGNIGKFVVAIFALNPNEPIPTLTQTVNEDNRKISIAFNDIIDTIDLNYDDIQFKRATTISDLVYQPSNSKVITVKNNELKIIGEVNNNNTVAFFYDITGKLIIEKFLNPEKENYLKIPNLQSGLYFLTIVNNNKVEKFKIIVK